MEAHAPGASRPTTNSGSNLFGLPAKLAVLALGMIVLCVGGVAWYADQQIQKSQHAAMRAEAKSAAQSLMGKTLTSDFASSGDAAVNDRLTTNLAGYPKGTGIVLWSTSAGSAAKLAASSGINNVSSAAPASVARSLVRGDVYEFVTVNGKPAVRITTPFVEPGTESVPVGVVQVVHAGSDAAAQMQQTRLLLWIAAGIGASLLGLLLLLLLQRELFKPLEQMRYVMDQVRGGAKGVRIGWNRGDELGATADDFDTMLNELEDAERELAKYVTRDPLTGLLNADAYAERMGDELTRARREGHSVSFVVLDVDDLGGVNERHGEEAGDNVLRAMGEAVQACIRPTDVSGRIGGDRIAVGLIGADAAQSARVLERLQSEISRRVRIAGANTVEVTTSIGVAAYPADTTDQRELGKLAAAALEHARSEGRGKAFAWAPGGAYHNVTHAPALSSSDGEGGSGEPEREFTAAVFSMARAFESMTDGRAGHGQRVARLVEALGAEYGLTDAHVRELKAAAAVHEIGAIIGAAPMSPEGIATTRGILEGARMEPIANVIEEVASGPSSSSSAEAQVLAAADWLDTELSGADGADLDAVVAGFHGMNWTTAFPELRDALTAIISNGKLAAVVETTTAAPVEDAAGSDAAEAA